MRRVVLDTNVLVSFLTDRDAGQQRRAARLLESGDPRRTQWIVPQIVLIELVFVLSNVYDRSDEEISGILRDLLDLPGVRTLDDLPWRRTLSLWPERVPDFADAALAAIAVENRLEAVATFDRTFSSRLRGLGVETPLQNG